MFSFWSQHIYLYSDTGTKLKISHLTEKIKTKPTPSRKRKLTREPEDPTPPFVSWESWPGLEAASASPGHFRAYAVEMDEVRKEFLERGWGPKITLASETRIKRMRFTLPKKNGMLQPSTRALHVHAINENWTSAERFADEFNASCARNIKYKGQSPAAVTFQALMSVTHDRLELSHKERADIQGAGWDVRCVPRGAGP